MPQATVLTAIGKYVSVKRTELGPDIDNKLADLSAELMVNAELQDLLSRPVHFQMAVRVLPRWNRPFAHLDRARLYESFIDQIIDRELRRLPRPSRLSRQARRRFAADLAVLMNSQGNSRAIRWTAIPESLLEAYKTRDDSYDDVRRELIRACFLESKSPDILYFPHKSFGEYLVAERIVLELRSDVPRVDSLGAEISAEIASFVGDLASDEDWRRALDNVPANTSIVGTYVRGLLRQDGAVPQQSIDALLSVVGAEETLAQLRLRNRTRMGERLAFDLSELVEVAGILTRNNRKVAANPTRLAVFLLASPATLAAVHAYRAIAKSDLETAHLLLTLLRPTDELDRWRRNAWLTGSHGGSGNRREEILEAARPVLEARLLDLLAHVRALSTDGNSMATDSVGDRSTKRDLRLSASGAQTT